MAPEIMPGRPPIKAVMRPTIKAAYSPTRGSTPATKAKAIASGTKARATVKPANISTFERWKLKVIGPLRRRAGMDIRSAKLDSVERITIEAFIGAKTKSRGL